MSKKILAITHQLDRTGAPIVLINLLEIFKSNGYSIDVVSLKGGPLMEELQKKGFPVTIKERIINEREAFAEHALNYDLVIANTLVSFEAIYALDGAEVPVIWWIHEGVHIFDYLYKLLPDFNKLSQNIHPIAVSPLVKNLIYKYYKLDVPVLPIPVPDIPPAQKSPEKKDITRFVIAGTYSKAKGQDVLAHAIKGLPTDVMSQCEFVFCGNEDTVDDEVFSAVRSLCEFPNVKKLGSISRNEVLDLIENADCVLVSSREDPIPTVAVEAFMKETLCICTDACGISHYINDGHDGVICLSNNSDALRDAIEKVVKNKGEYEAVAKRGRDIFKKYYSEAVITKKFLDLAGKLTDECRRLIIFVGVYDILDIFAYQLKKYFWEMGYEIFLFDSSKMQESLGRLGPFVDKPVRAVITLNNLGYNMELREGSIIWDDLGIPVINILMDHPFCYKEALDNSPRSAIVLSPDFNHMNYTSRFFPNIPVSGFLAHAGIELVGPKKKLKDRKYDVIYTGSISRGFADKIIPEWDKYDFDAKRLCEDSFKELKKNPHKTTEQVIEEELIKIGKVYSDSELSQLISDFHYVDLYIVSYYREKVIETLARAGINIEIYGFGWEICDWIELPNVNYRGRIPAEDVLLVMQDTKIVLSTMTWFKAGTHDRVFNGMLQGALTVSDESDYMNDEFTGRLDEDGSDNRQMLLFSLSEIEKLPEQINEMLNDLDLAQKIADRGYMKAKEAHTWAHRAMEIEEGILSQLN